MKEIKSTKEFNELIAGDKPVLVKFEADWCPDCKRMDMFIDPIVEKYDAYSWYEADRDVLPEIAEKYEVMGIPSLLIFKDGEKQAHLHSANAKSPKQVTDFLDEVKI
ncbi:MULTISPECIES: thioredoxin family protein [unclassified Sporosarcina]|uniref:thioredoxin family protein n=1 Tax=unclassified Sporosarcina TaxID=2647733 RepID=UPI00203EC9F9|nr:MULTISPECIES: thioredoxin family protein [unclassified Sporosarcina]GKV67326.1 thioredoxin-like protein YdbP [Sporosarcina sp. NCCP-2331]GLB57676.1 thioredoxin-like protein YdbP [Sporosarcina sp. NCCP-2378]